MKETLMKMVRVFPLLFILGVASIGSWIFAFRTNERNQGSYRMARLRDVESNWGSNIYQKSPNVAAELFEGSADEVRMAAKNIKIAQSDVKAELNMDYRRKGLIYFPTYVTNFKANYVIKNENDKPVKASLLFPLPEGDSLVWDVEMVVGSSKEGVNIRTGEIAWKGEMKAKEEKQVLVKYSARGLEDFSYALANNQGLQDFKMEVAVNGADKVDFPKGALSPTKINERENGWDLGWNFANVLTSPNITVKIFAKQNLSEQVSRLFWYLPILLGMFLLTVLGVAKLAKKQIGVFDLSLLIALYIIFYPLLTYLVSVLDWMNLYQGMGIAWLVISIITLYLYAYLFGSKVALTLGVLLQLAYLGFFPVALLLPQLTGLLSIIGVVGILAAVVWARTKSVK
jgi:hypothetical protein